MGTLNGQAMIFIQAGKRLPILPSLTLFTVRLGYLPDELPTLRDVGGSEKIHNKVWTGSQNLLKTGDFRALRQSSECARFYRLASLVEPISNRNGSHRQMKRERIRTPRNRLLTWRTANSSMSPSSRVLWRPGSYA